MIGWLNEWLWAESFWLPGNFSWTELERKDTDFYPRATDLLIAIPIAVLLYFIRCLYERFVALNIGRCFNMKEHTHKNTSYNEVLEQAFRKHGKTFPSSNLTAIRKLAQETNMTNRQMERWWRKRIAHGKPNKMQKFTETCWRFMYYFLSFWGGLYVLWDKPYFWDTKECWVGYPKQHIPLDIRVYYLVQLSFYISLVFSIFNDVRRKDFQQMVVHHFATIFLMGMSWCNNMVRVGALVLCLHDTVDYWLEGAKLANYLRYGKLCDCLFLVFASLWFVTRLVIFPMRLLNTTWFECHDLLGDFGSRYVFNILLSILFVLHIIWFCMIVKMVFKFLVKGQVDKDSRSDTDSYPSSDENSKSEEATDDIRHDFEGHDLRPRSSSKVVEGECSKNKNGVVS